ncbi:MAG: Ldh family oxidoreductase [Pseudomonadota bacterium]
MTTVIQSLDTIREVIIAALRAHGADADNAAAVARTLVAAEADGCQTHGLFRVAGYCRSMASGKVNGAAKPSVTRLGPGAVRVNGDGGWSSLPLEASYDPLAEAAAETGVAAAAIVNMFHYAALWPEVEAMARRGYVALACTAYKPVVAPFGGNMPFYGTDPLAFAWPRGPHGSDTDPVVFDFATSAIARGEVQVAMRDGHQMAPGTGLDKNGNPTTDPAEILDGMMLPFGGYKGSLIMMMVELLCSSLIGEQFSFEAGETDVEDGGPARGGEFLLAIDPTRFAGDGWAEHGERFFARLGAIDGVHIPGDRRYQNRRQTPVDGCSVPLALWAEVEALAGHG